MKTGHTQTNPVKENVRKLKTAVVATKVVPWIQMATLAVGKRIRNDFADFDYIDKLDEKARNFLIAFHKEYYGTDFKHKHKKLHKSDKSRKSCYNRNNQMNRDIYAILKCRNRLVSIHHESSYQPQSSKLKGYYVKSDR